MSRIGFINKESTTMSTDPDALSTLDFEAQTNGIIRL